MTRPRTFAGRLILLERGPMRARDFALAMALPNKDASRVLQQLVETDMARRVTRRGEHRFLYAAV